MQTPLLWVDIKGSPALQLVGKVGFLPVVWIKIAQMLCDAKGFYQCSSCGDWYSRTKRQPPRNRNNFCDTCYEGNHGAAKLHMRRRRARTS
jgi:hypothetical protein